MIDLYVKVPVELLDEGPVLVWQYCHLYHKLLQRRNLNLLQYSRDMNMSYSIARRLKRIALKNINQNNGAKNVQPKT